MLVIKKNGRRQHDVYRFSIARTNTYAGSTRD